MRILVVEDERKVANFISQGLQEEGHTVEVARDGEAALDLLENGPPYDLIVLDVMLPRRDGFAVLRDRKSTRLNSSHQIISYAVFCLKKKKKTQKMSGAMVRGVLYAHML